MLQAKGDWSQLGAGQRKIYSSDESCNLSAASEDITLNHTCLKISDPDRTLAFYNEVLGFKPIMAWNTGPQTVFFLSQPAQGEDMMDVFKTMQRRSGLIELLYLHNTPPREVSHAEALSQPPSFGYFHIGLTVKDVSAVIQRAEDCGYPGVRVIKPLGPHRSMRVMGLPEATPEFHESTGFIFHQVAFITDPDGNWIELVPKEMHKAKALSLS